MTRASLLHILDHVDRISDAEVRELEQLAGAFPYCQTAHLLLAKAAHDRGSMLASQRLRRAATYAADRELLRQLLEQPATSSEPTIELLPEPELATPTQETAVATVAAAIPASHPPRFFTSAPEPEEPIVAEVEVEDIPDTLPEITGRPAETVALSATELVAFSAPSVEDVEPQVAFTEEVFSAPEPEEATQLVEEGVVVEKAYTTQEESNLQPVAAVDEHIDLPTVGLADTIGATAPEEPSPALLTTATENGHDLLEQQEELAPALAEEANDDLLPAVAPPIRPPAEAGISRFEFGLVQPPLPEPSSYQLPGLEPEEEVEIPDLLEPTPPIVTAPFLADEDLGYALSAGSRLGYDLQPHDGFTLDLPLESFFEPDALLLAHMAAHRPKPKPSSLDLINQFLKNQPRIKSPAGVPLPAEEQMDLSVRSNAAAPVLASESLAKIMIRQGKKDKAIEIYERLMERQPEKKAYFSEQIQQLQQSPE